MNVTVRYNKNFYDFTVYQKPAISNVQIKSHSNISSHITMAVFKGLLSRALKICSKKNILNKEIEFLITVFIENGRSIINY